MDISLTPLPSQKSHLYITRSGVLHTESQGRNGTCDRVGFLAFYCRVFGSLSICVVLHTGSRTPTSRHERCQKWLRQNVATYGHGNGVFIDLDSTLSNPPPQSGRLQFRNVPKTTLSSTIDHDSGNPSWSQRHIQPITTVTLNSAVFVDSYPSTVVALRMCLLAASSHE